MKCYAFDVDHTLEVSDGPVTMDSLIHLATEGNILGLCGNFAVVLAYYPNDWFRLFSFIGPMGMTKAQFLLQLKTYVRCEEVVMVGNALPDQSLDKLAADEAGVRFILESDFAKGVR